MENQNGIASVEKAVFIYRQIVRKKTVALTALIVGTLLCFFLNVVIGSTTIPLSAVLSALAGDENTTLHTVIWDIRLPMACMAILAGAGFSICGCEMQTILGNPMASPYTLGISAAAAFGAAVGIILDINILGIPSNLLVTVNSFLFALVASFLIYRFSAWHQSKRHLIILFGIALNFIFHAFTMFLQYIADENKLQSLIFWSFGSLSKSTWEKTVILAIVFLFTFFFLLHHSWKLTALTLNDQKALSLGVDVYQLRCHVIILVSLLTATAVCFVGTIGFLGLVAPHLARGLTGEDQRFLLPVSALFGAFILSVASMLSKILIPGALLPIGLITSFIGIPFFIILIFNQGRKSL